MQDKVQEAITSAQTIVVIQADNPDADSLGSALALEHILGDLGKHVVMYCGVHIPDYLKYLSGWDRVVDSLPAQFDLSIIVDASTYTLLDKIQMSGQFSWVTSKSCIVLDHHATVEKPLDFTQLQIVDEHASSTGEVIYGLATYANWKISSDASRYLMCSILGDTQGLTNDLTTATTYRIMADLTELGANRSALEELRREYGKMAEKIYHYKAQLIQRTVFEADGKIAYVTVPQTEINEYSPLYNPAALVQPDMLQVKGVRVALVFKTYDDGRVTAAIRANNGYPVAAKLAERMGGGGHDYAAGFKITATTAFSTIKNTSIQILTELLDSSAGDIA